MNVAVITLKLTARIMHPSILLGAVVTREQIILEIVMVVVIFAAMVPIYKWLERRFGRLALKERKRICRNGQRISSVMFVVGIIGSILCFLCLMYMQPSSSKTSDDNMYVSRAFLEICMSMSEAMVVPSLSMVVIGVVGWGVLVCLDFMPARRKVP